MQTKRMILINLLFFTLLVILVACTKPEPTQPQPPTTRYTLGAVKQRGKILCGLDAGFIDSFNTSKHEAFNKDFCRALATTVLGNANAVEFIQLSGQQKYSELTNGGVDVISGTTVTSSKDSALGLNFSSSIFYNTQGQKAMAVAHGNDQWFDIVNWTVFATFLAEEYKISSTNLVDASTKTEIPDVQRFLGMLPDNVEQLGLSKDAFFKMIEQVGNYAEIYERSFGNATPRGLNASYLEDGLLLAPPIR